MPGYDFAAVALEREPYVITLSYKRSEDGTLLTDEAGEYIPDDKVVLPPVLPAKLMLRFFNKDREELKAMAASESAQLQVGMQVIEELIGKDKWDHVLEVIGFANINDLLTDIFNHYGGGKKGEGEDEEEEGKAEKGEESQSTISSTTSEPSTPTSNGSTHEPTNVSTITPSGGPSSSPESRIFQPKVSS